MFGFGKKDLQPPLQDHSEKLMEKSPEQLKKSHEIKDLAKQLNNTITELKSNIMIF